MLFSFAGRDERLIFQLRFMSCADSPPGAYLQGDSSIELYTDSASRCLFFYRSGMERQADISSR